MTESVPVQRDDVRVKREPITDANRDAATTGPEISDEAHEVTLSAERAVTETVAVPKERVRMERDVVTDQQQVEGDVRKELIDVEGDIVDPDRCFRALTGK